MSTSFFCCLLLVVRVLGGDNVSYALMSYICYVITSYMDLHIDDVALRSHVLHILRHNVLHELAHRLGCNVLNVISLIPRHNVLLVFELLTYTTS